MHKRAHSQEGFSLVEVIFATSIILILVLALVGIHNVYLNLSTSNLDTTKAVFLSEEAVEAMRFIRNDSWEDNVAILTLDTPYHLALSAGTWTLTGTYALIDNKFERTLQFSSVYRDAEGRIVSSGGTLDPDSRLVSVSVSWPYKGATTTKTIMTYLNNLYDN